MEDIERDIDRYRTRKILEGRGLEDDPEWVIKLEEFTGKTDEPEESQREQLRRDVQMYHTYKILEGRGLQDDPEWVVKAGNYLPQPRSEGSATTETLVLVGGLVFISAVILFIGSRQQPAV